MDIQDLVSKFYKLMDMSEYISDVKNMENLVCSDAKRREGRNWGQNECRISYTCPRITHKAHVFWGQNHENLVHPGKELRPPRKKILNLIQNNNQGHNFVEPVRVWAFYLVVRELNNLTVKCNKTVLRGGTVTTFKGSLLQIANHLLKEKHQLKITQMN